jgi:outer membrane protein TolC
MLRRFIVFLFACLPVLAQIATPPRVGIGVIKKELSLAGAIELAVRNNLEIEIEKTGISAAVETVEGARGYLDSRFRWSPRLEDRSTPTSSPLMGADGKLAESIHTQNFYFDQRLPWQGAALNVSFENDRQSTTNPFTALSPYVVSRLSVSFNLPLLRNRKIDRERANLTISTTEVGLSETGFELKVIDVVARVEEAYWNLVAARQNVEVTSEAVNLAREQLARTKRMIDSGTLPPVEIAAAEAELERRVDTWFASIGVVTEVENALKLLTTGSRDEPLWDDEIIPAENRTVEAPATDDVRAAVETALRRRPELRQLSLRKQGNETQQELARDQVRPRLNLIAGYSSAGLAGDPLATENPFSGLMEMQYIRLNELSGIHGLEPIPPVSFGGVPANQIGGYGDVLGGVFRSRYPTAFAGVSLDWISRNRTAKSQLAQTAITERRLDLERTRLEQIIEAQVRNSLQAIQTATQRIRAAEASARASQEKLASEIRLFQTGESTNFLVLTRQNEMADSRRRAVIARLDFNKAVARLQQALGTTLETHNVQLQ